MTKKLDTYKKRKEKNYYHNILSLESLFMS